MTQKQFHTINDKRLAYHDSGGDGAPLLLIHGVIDGAGHFLIFTHTDIFIQSVEAFLASVKRK